MTDGNRRRTAEADEVFKRWMRHNLEHAASRFGVSVVGDPVFGWALRSISAPAHDREGNRRWLRVVSDKPEFATGDWWTGNADANPLTDIRKSYVLDIAEWDEYGWRRQRAELMTFLPGSPVSPTDALHDELELPDHWWQELRRTVACTGRGDGGFRVRSNTWNRL